MTVFTHILTAALLHLLWQGSLTAVALWIMVALLRNHSANLRYALCCAALALVAILPVLTASLLLRQINSSGLGGHSPSFPFDFSAASAVKQPIGSPRWMGPIGAVLETWTLPVWSLGVVLFSLRILCGYRYVSSLRRRGTAPPPTVSDILGALCRRMSLAAPVQALISEISGGPGVVGWLRPVVLLPAAALTGLTPQQLEAVLAHELAHIRRHDYLVNLLQMVVEALYFYHPAVWWISARIREEREFCCDDAAIGVCGDRLIYTRALGTLEKMRLSIAQPAMGAAAGPLWRRIERLLSPPGHGRVPSRVPAILAATLAVICVAWNVKLARGQEAGEQGQVTVFPKGVTIVSQEPSLAYPKGLSVTGAFTVQLALQADGTVVRAELIPPYKRTLDTVPEEAKQNVLKAVRQWRFALESGSATAPYLVVAFTPPDSPGVRYMKRGDELYRTGHRDDALRWYQDGEKKFPELKIDLMKRETEAYLGLGRAQEAYQRDLQILALKPDDAEARGLKASYMLDRGDTDAAIKELLATIPAMPDNFVARFNLGRAYLATGKSDRAVQQFEIALRIRPNYLPARLGLVRVDLKDGHYAEALQGSEKALRANPQSSAALLLKSNALVGLGRSDEARAALRQILAHDPANPEALAEQKKLDELQK